MRFLILQARNAVVFSFQRWLRTCGTTLFRSQSSCWNGPMRQLWWKYVKMDRFPALAGIFMGKDQVRFDIRLSNQRTNFEPTSFRRKSMRPFFGFWARHGSWMLPCTLLEHVGEPTAYTWTATWHSKNGSSWKLSAAKLEKPLFVRRSIQWYPMVKFRGPWLSERLWGNICSWKNRGGARKLNDGHNTEPCDPMLPWP